MIEHERKIIQIQHIFHLSWRRAQNYLRINLVNKIHHVNKDESSTYE